MMTRQEKLSALAKPTIAYWTDLGGVEVKEIVHDLDDYLVCVTNSQSNNPNVHRVRVNGEGKLVYVRIHDTRLYLCDCMRANH